VKLTSESVYNVFVVCLMSVESSPCPSPPVSLWCSISASVWLEACLFWWYNAMWCSCRSR